jgi:hypothetical protein
MDGSPGSPPVLDGSPHSMEESGEPSPCFSGLHSTNHKIRWNQEYLKEALMHILINAGKEYRISFA